MPEEHAGGPQQYDLNELENAAAYAVTEAEKITEAFSEVTGARVSVHTPEASWSDPVRLLEALSRGGVFGEVKFREGRTAVMLSREDASLYSALLMGMKGDELTEKIKQRPDDESVGVLRGLFSQAFVSAGGGMSEILLTRNEENPIPKIEEVLGPSFLAVKVTVSMGGYSDGHIYRAYDKSFVEANFRGDQAAMGMATQVLPSTSEHEVLEAVVEEEEEKKQAAPEKVRRMKASARPGSLDGIKRIPVTLRVVLARRQVKLRDALKFLPGEVIEFEKKITESAEVLIDSKLIAGGDVVRSGQHYGIKVGKVSPVKDRLESLIL